MKVTSKDVRNWPGLALAVALAFLVPVCMPEALANAHDEILALRSDKRTTVISDHLVVNVDASLRYVSPQKCQIDGEVELSALSAISALEESFIFVPSMCIWIEAGYNETERSVSLDETLLYAVARQYGNVAVYHIQPGRRPSVVNYFPSYRDFISMVLIDAQFLQEPNIAIAHRAVTEYAVFDYRFADWPGVLRRAEIYEAKGLGRYVGQNLAYEFNREKYLRDYAVQVAVCVERVQDLPARITECRRVATELFVLDIRAVQLAAQ